MRAAGKKFIRQHKADGKLIESRCRYCGRRVGTASDARALRAAEAAHSCPKMRQHDAA